MLIPLKLLRDKPLQRQLHEQLRELIITSRLATGTRMPSTRMLADQFSISRITVLLTYDRLIAEGYLRTIPAKGTFVQAIAAADSTRSPAAGGYEIRAERQAGQPDCRLFPASKWRTLIRGAVDRYAVGLAEEQADGDRAPRQAIARWMSASRGVAVDADQIILAHDRRHALRIAAHMSLRPGGRVVIESPGDPAAEMLLAGTGATVVAIPVDDEGIQTEHLPAGPVGMALVTPEHQRPLGVVMSLARRHALLAWAGRSGALVIEEDSDGELRYDEVDAPPLMRLDQEGVVAHIGDFAASLGPGITLGYLAVPHRLIGPALAASRLVGACSGRLEGDALAILLDSGSYARHLHRIRKTYLERRNTMVRSLRRHFGEDTRITGLSAGLHLAWTPPPHIGSAGTVADMARRFGLNAGHSGDRVVLLGFGADDERLIETGINRLAEALVGARENSVLARERVFVEQ